MSAASGVWFLLGTPLAGSAAAQGPEELLRAGQRQLDAGNAAAAVESFRRLVEAAPGSRSHYYLGIALLQDDRPGEAALWFRRAEEAARAAGAPPNPALALSLGTALLRSGESEAAVTVLEAAAARHPRAAPILLQLGYAHYARLEGEAARRVLLRARAAAPENPLAHFYLGLAESALGSLEAAGAAFAEAIRLAPGDAEARVALGRTLSQLGRTEEARRHYLEALAARPGSAAALVGLGLLDLREGDAAAAAGRFAAALEHAPRHRQALYNLAAALTLLGRAGEAAEVRRRFDEVAGEEAPGRSLSRTASRR